MHKKQKTATDNQLASTSQDVVTSDAKNKKTATNNQWTTACKNNVRD